MIWAPPPRSKDIHQSEADMGGTADTGVPSRPGVLASSRLFYGDSGGCCFWLWKNYCPSLSRARGATAHAPARGIGPKGFPVMCGFRKEDRHNSTISGDVRKCSTQESLCAQFDVSKAGNCPRPQLNAWPLGTSNRLFPPRFPVLCYAIIPEARELRIVATPHPHPNLHP